MSVEGCGEPEGSPCLQEEGGARGKHGFPREREPEASVAHGPAPSAAGLPGPIRVTRNR